MTKIKNVGHDVLNVTKILHALCVTKDFLLTQITWKIVLLVLIHFKQTESHQYVWRKKHQMTESCQSSQRMINS